MTCLGVIVVCVRLSNYEIITMMAREKHILAGGEQDEEGRELSSPHLRKREALFFFVLIVHAHLQGESRIS